MLERVIEKRSSSVDPLLRPLTISACPSDRRCAPPGIHVALLHHRHTSALNPGPDAAS
jgi:hypothetical protein